MIRSDDVYRHYGNRKLWTALQRKRKSAPKFFEYNSENEFLYQQVVNTINWSRTFFQIWTDLIESEENQGYAYHISKIVYFYHVIEHLSSGVVTEDQDKEFKSSCQKYLRECRTPEGVDRIKDSVQACFRADDDTVASEECKQWAQEIANHVNCVITMAFPWFNDEHDWEYCLKVPRIIQRISVGYAAHCFGQAGGACTSVPYTKRLRLYKDSVTCKEGKTFRRLSKFQQQKSEAEKFYKDTSYGKLVFTRVLTYVSPGNLRDTFIPDQPTMRILTEIECLCDSIIKSLPEIRIGKSGIPIKETPYYLMLDSKKFGLTFPQQLLEDTLRAIGVLNGIDVEYYCQCLRHMFVYKDGTMYKMNRGFGLGNLNKLSTLAHYLIAKETGLPFLVYSDDIVYCLERYDDHTLSKFVEIYESYGLIVNMKKTCISTYWEFLGNSSYPGYEQRWHLTEICNLALSIYGSEVECYLSESAIMTDYFRISRPMKRTIFFINHTIAPLDKVKLLIPKQSGGYLWTDDYGNWVETHTTYPVYSYHVERPRMDAFEYVEPEYKYLESFLKPTPLDFKWIRRPHGKMIETISYPYRNKSALELFCLLVKEGYHPTFLLSREHELTENQAAHYAEIQLDHVDTRWSFEIPVLRLEHVYPCEEGVLDLLSHCTNYPRMLLGEYHRRYRCIFSCPYKFRRRYTREQDVLQAYLDYLDNLGDVTTLEGQGFILPSKIQTIQVTPESHPDLNVQGLLPEAQGEDLSDIQCTNVHIGDFQSEILQNLLQDDEVDSSQNGEEDYVLTTEEEDFVFDSDPEDF